MRFLCLLLLCVLVLSTGRKGSINRLKNNRQTKRAGAKVWTPAFSYCPGGVAPHHPAPCPDHWGDLVNDPASPWETGPTNECASTDRQSPIPFPPVEEITEVGPYASVEGRYRRERLNGRVANNGHTVKVTIDGEVNTLKITALVDANDHRTYHLKEFHFHAPSEHHLGVAHAFELHLVHKNPQPAVCTVPHMEDGAVAVGILFTVGAANVALGHILDGTLPAAPEHGHPPTEQAFANDVEIDLVTGLLDSITSFITYPGSLTTPPCTQVVRWLVSTTPLTLSQDQLDKFKNVLPEHHNARPMQTRNVEGQPITRVDTVTFASQ